MICLGIVSLIRLSSSSDDGTCRIWDARYSQTSPRVYIPKPPDVIPGWYFIFSSIKNCLETYAVSFLILLQGNPAFLLQVMLSKGTKFCVAHTMQVELYLSLVARTLMQGYMCGTSCTYYLFLFCQFSSYMGLPC